MNVRGTIYHNPQFQFHDGIKGNKLLVLLNTPIDDEDYVFVKTTSQQKARAKTPGCGTYYAQGEYFISRGTEGFPEDTWIVLSDLYPISPKDIDNDSNWIVLKNEKNGMDTESENARI